METKIKENIKNLSRVSASNIAVCNNILEDIKEMSLVEAVNKYIRSYDESLAYCLEKGASEDDEQFMYDFTTAYLNTILALVSNLFLVDNFAKKSSNRAFLKSKVRECLIYIDRL